MSLLGHGGGCPRLGLHVGPCAHSLMYVDNVRVGLQESQVTALKPEGTRDPVGGMGCILAGGTGDLALNPSFSGPQFPMGKMA